MKTNFIMQSFEILKQPSALDGELAFMKHIEKIGRVCYKSEDKITDDSAPKFVNMLMGRKHWAMLEHANIIFKIDDACDDFNIIEEEFKLIASIENPDDLDLLKFIHFLDVYHEVEIDGNDDHLTLVAGSPTAFNYLAESTTVARMYEYLIKDYPDGNISNAFVPGYKQGDLMLISILEFLHKQFPGLFKFPFKELNSEYIKKLSLATEEDLNKLTPNEQAYVRTMSVKFITNRSISHELVRHRPCSFAQESTRYVNYNNRGLQIIIPEWMSTREINALSIWNDSSQNSNDFNIIKNILTKSDEQKDHFVSEIHNSAIWFEFMVKYLSAVVGELSRGLAPQQVRGVFPNDLKTEIIVTAFMSEWKHIFDMRADSAAHPQMQELMYPVLHEVYKLYPGIFKDIYNKKMKESEVS